jgi:hypothetical protein
VLLSEAQPVPVASSTFDAWFAAERLMHVDVIKIDVEGTEERVVAGMERTIAAGAIAHIVCETSPDGAIPALLRRHGYEMDVIESLGGLQNIGFSRTP